MPACSTTFKTPAPPTARSKCFIATGYTDLITPYLAPTYLVRQLPPLEGASPITIEDYAGGHMLYLRPDSRRALKKDVEAMYERALKSSPQG